MWRNQPKTKGGQKAGTEQKQEFQAPTDLCRKKESGKWGEKIHTRNWELLRRCSALCCSAALATSCSRTVALRPEVGPLHTAHCTANALPLLLLISLLPTTTTIVSTYTLHHSPIRTAASSIRALFADAVCVVRPAERHSLSSPSLYGASGSHPRRSGVYVQDEVFSPSTPPAGASDDLSCRLASSPSSDSLFLPIRVPVRCRLFGTHRFDVRSSMASSPQ